MALVADLLDPGLTSILGDGGKGYAPVKGWSKFFEHFSAFLLHLHLRMYVHEVFLIPAGY